MKKKGFTLIELLAVITVLGVLSLVSVPLIYNQIETAKQDSYKASVRSIFDAVSNYLANNTEISDVPSDGINIPDSYYYEKLGLKNADFISGRIYRDADGVLVVDQVWNGTYCAGGSKNELRVSKGTCDLIDNTAPEIKIVASRVTTSSITITVNAKDEESGITNYKYYINGTLKTELRDNVYTFKDLKPNTEYTIRVVGTNGNKLESESTLMVTTSVREITMIANPTTWSHSKTITISFPSEYENEVYRYKLNGSINWITVVGTKVDVLIEEDSTITAQIVYGNKVVAEKTSTFVKIDNEGPIIQEIVGNTEKWSLSKQIQIVATDGLGVGIDSYSFDGGLTWNKLNQKVFTSQDIAIIAVKDKLDNISEIKPIYIGYIDNNIPSNHEITAKVASGNFGSYNGETWTNQQVTLKAGLDPNGTPSGYLYQWYKKNSSGTFVAIAGATGQTLSLTSEGTATYKVEISTGAGAGPVSSINEFTVKIDKTAPNCIAPKGNTTWRKSNLVVKPTCSDSLSGCVSESQNITFTESAKTATLSFKFADNAGNYCNYSSSDYPVYIDKENPRIGLGSVIKTTKTLLIPLSIIDNYSGVKSVRCEYGTDTNYKLTGTISNAGCEITNLKPNTMYYYRITAIDNVGHTSYKTGQKATGQTGISFSFNPTEWSKAKEITVDFNATNLTSYTYYIKPTVAVTSNISGYACGNGTDPGACGTSATTNLAAGYWYKVSNDVIVTFTSDGKLYTRINDGNIYSSSATATVNVDIDAPTISIGNIKTATKKITIPLTVKDSESGVKSTTCKYGTSKSYGSTGEIIGAECKMTGLSAGTTYYYKITAIDNVGNETSKEGSITSGSTSVSFGSSPTGWSRIKTATVDFTSSNVTNYTYYVKTTVSTTSNVEGYACGNGTNPGTCITSTTKSFSAGYWYKVDSDLSLTFNANGIIYARINDGDIFSTSGNHSVTQIDATAPAITVGTVSKTTTTLSIPITVTDSESGVKFTTCRYGTGTSSSSSSSDSYNHNGTISGGKCKITGLTAGKTYYYKIMAIDTVGNIAEKLGSAKTGNVSISFTPNTSSSCVKTKKVTVDFTLTDITTPIYYVKATSNVTSNVDGYACGNSTNPGSCSSTKTKTFSSGYWYKVSGDVALTISANSTIYATVHDGNTYLSASSFKASVDTTKPTISLGTPKITTNSFTAIYTAKDDCGIKSATCVYSPITSAGYSNTGIISNGECKAKGLKKGTPYKYKITVTDNSGNSTSKEGSLTTTTGIKEEDDKNGIPGCRWYMRLENINNKGKNGNLLSANLAFSASTGCGELVKVDCKKDNNTEQELPALFKNVSSAGFEKPPYKMTAFKLSNTKYAYLQGKTGSSVLKCTATFGNGTTDTVYYYHEANKGIRDYNVKHDPYWFYEW